MNRTNYHTHSLFCDGRAQMDDFLRFAVAWQFSSFGFSSHAPLPFSTAWTMEWDRMNDYLSEFHRLKLRYQKRLELCIGLEIDYLDQQSNPSMACFQQLPLDYRIGSVHLLADSAGRIVDIDCPPSQFRKLVDCNFRGDVVEVICRYYRQLDAMLDAGGFDIVGHPDKMHYNALCYRPGLLDEPWYDNLVRGYLAKMVKKGYIVEINTKAYEETRTFFPNERYYTYLYQLGAKVQVNSDAHYPDKIASGREAALQALWRAGFRTVTEWHEGRWQQIPMARWEEKTSLI